MKRAIVLIAFSPLVALGVIIGICVYGTQLGIEIVHQAMERMARWVNW